MKKLFYLMLISASVAMTSCTEEDVKPKSENTTIGNEGGTAADPIIK